MNEKATYLDLWEEPVRRALNRVLRKKNKTGWIPPKLAAIS